jgi:putative photosynthetic complex assembly protein 2
VSELWLPALYALFVWWFGTGAILLLDRLPRPSRRASLLGATVLALCALGVMHLTAETRTVGAALAAFTAAIVLWGWHEMAFLSGLLTGPNRKPLPVGATGWRRFRLAALTLIHHEIALALTAAGLILWLGDAANPVALCTFLLLWILRLSAKLNLFLGAPNVAEDFLPDDLRYMQTYFARRALNPLFPISVTAGTAFVVWGVAQGSAPGADAFTAAGWALAGALTALGVLEHWFMALPVREAALWRWYTKRRSERSVKRVDKALTMSPLSAPTMLGR